MDSGVKTPKKAANGGENWNQLFLPISRTGPCSLAIRLESFGKKSNISADNLFGRFYMVWHSSTTMSLTQLFPGEFMS